MGLNDGGGGPYADANDTQSFHRFGTAGFKDQRTLACPGGSYIYQVRGSGGSAVDQINGIGCRSIVDGSTVDVNTGSLGESGGGSGTTLTANGGDGATGFWIGAETEVEQIRPVWRNAGTKSCCSSTTYDAGSALGPGQNKSAKYVCDQNHLVNSISGATSSNNSRLTDYAFSCRNFNNMARIAQNPQDCCLGKDSSQDCLDVQPLLSCPAVVKTYCSQGTNIFTDSACVAAVGAPSAINGLDAVTVANIKLKSCAAGDNYKTDACSDFCTAKTGAAIPTSNTSTDALVAGSTIKDGCNTLYATKCSIDSSSAVCGCQRPFSSYDNSSDIPNSAMFVKDPACYFATCRNFGYFAKPLSEHGCPSCVQYLQLNTTGSNNAISQIQQSCSVNGNTLTSTNSPSGTTTDTSQTPTVGPSATSKTTIWIVGLIVLILCCLASLAVIFMS